MPYGRGVVVITRETTKWPRLVISIFTYIVACDSYDP